MHKIAFYIADFPIYSYGLAMAAAFLIGSVMVYLDAERFGIPREKALDVFIWSLFAGLIGSRLLFVIFHRGYFIHRPLEIFAVREGGMAVQGGLILAIFVCFLVSKASKVPFAGMCDLAAPYVALGQGIGRIGCFLNGCCYGVETAARGVVFPGENVARVPIQLYDSASMFVIALFLWAVREKRYPKGAVLALYLIFYSAVRFVLERFRGDNPLVFGGLTAAQLLAMATFAAGILSAFLALAGKRGE
jgi:phosphatidylglycerol:prolipoprotein diacylglycerol transferase